MLDIDTIRVDAKARRDGAWVTPLDDYPSFEVRTKGLGPKYRDAVQAAERRTRREKKIASNKPIPAALQEQINVECLIDTCLLDVRGLTRGKAAVTFDEFCGMIRGDEFPTLRTAAFTAGFLVGEPVADEIEDAEGNSAGRSAGTSAGVSAPAPSLNA